MIYVTRTVKVSSMSKFQLAVQWGVRLAAYLNETYGTNYQLLHGVGGEGLQLHWIVTFDSLAAMEEHTTARDGGQDEGYAAFLVEMNQEGLFAGWEDHIYRVMA